jgi:hypothetical protein
MFTSPPSPIPFAAPRANAKSTAYARSFASASNFSCAFRRATGETPGEFRSFVYRKAARKRALALLSAPPILRELWDSGAGRLSVQVLQEFYVNATRKLATPVAQMSAREDVSSYGAWIREPTTADTVTRAIDVAALAQRSHLGARRNPQSARGPTPFLH